MRRLLVLLLLVLVNLPAVDQWWTGHELDTRGREVVAVVLDGRVSGGRHLVDYKLPVSVDARQRLYSANIASGVYERALVTHRLRVRVVPGKPGSNRPEGMVSNPLFTVVAIGADTILLLVFALAAYRRRRPLAADDPRAL